MNLLPSERGIHAEKAIEKFDNEGELSIFEPCNCGNRIQHNNGGNYHDQIYLRRDSGLNFVKYETTCDLVAPAEWEECDDPVSIIRQYADWL